VIRMMRHIPEHAHLEKRRKVGGCKLKAEGVSQGPLVMKIT